MDEKTKKALYAERAKENNKDKTNTDAKITNSITNKSTLTECLDAYRAFLLETHDGEISSSTNSKLNNTQMFISELPDDPVIPFKGTDFFAERLAQFEAVYGKSAKREARIGTSDLIDYVIGKLSIGFLLNPFDYIIADDSRGSSLVLTDDEVIKLQKLAIKMLDGVYLVSLTLLPVPDKLVKGLTIDDIPQNGRIVAFKREVIYERRVANVERVRIRELGDKLASIEVSEEALTVLRNQKAYQEYRMKDARFATNNEHRFLFTTEKGFLYPEDRIKEQMDEIRKKMDIRKLRANQLYKIAKSREVGMMIDYKMA